VLSKLKRKPNFQTVIGQDRQTREALPRRLSLFSLLLPSSLLFPEKEIPCEGNQKKCGKEIKEVEERSFVFLVSIYPTG